MIATWCFIFVGVIRELSAAIMLFTSETKVISVLIFDLKESGDLGAIAVLGLAMLIITFARRHRRQPHPRLRRRALAQLRERLHGRRTCRRSPSPKSWPSKIAALDAARAAAGGAQQSARTC